MAILIGFDCGHGLSTLGKQSPKGEKEWSFNNQVGIAFEAEMKKYEGVKIKRYDDPTGKRDVPLKERTDNANKDKCDYFISFHHNASGNQWGNATGTEVFVYTKTTASSKAYKLAQSVTPVVASAYGLRNRGLKKANLHICRETNMPAILIEGGFMNGLKDIKVLRNKAILKNVGIAIAQAVAKHLGLKKKPASTTSTTTTKKPATSNSTASGSTYTVVKGDTLYSIATKYNTTVDKLKEWNNLKSNTLSIGQKLTVSQVKYHTVKSGETLYGLSKKYNTTVSKLKSWNGLKDSTLSIGQKLIVAK